MRREIKSMKKLIEEHKKDLLNDKKALERIEKRIEDRHKQRLA